MTIEIESLERARMLWDVLTGGCTVLSADDSFRDEFIRVVAGGLGQSAKAEREACAKVAEELQLLPLLSEMASNGEAETAMKHIAAAIRARGREGRDG